MSALRVVLGDQLSLSVPALADYRDGDIVLMCEVLGEATYVKHHKKKIAFLFSAMRHFAKELAEKGFTVRYVKLDDPENTGSFHGEVSRALKSGHIDHIITTFPGEYRVWQDMERWSETFGMPVDIREDTRFLCSRSEFAAWAEGRKELRMEYFYRDMRRKFSLLMNGPDPEGGQWNYDSENRKPAPDRMFLPRVGKTKPDDITKEVLALVAARFASHFGDLEPFDLAVTREQALVRLKEFIAERLPNFGDYQDAMLTGEPVLFHAHLSFYINAGLLDPLEVVAAAQQAYDNKDAPLNCAEGFIRQIIGWREYVRGVYWLKMPDYARENYLEARRRLPWFYWSGQTKMNCLHQCVEETKRNAYAHHIQRLMVLGNFALLAGLNPDAVNEWYLIVYADAYEWVELPNVTGMILFADAGLLASKPYAASGAYIDRMSDYCKGCRYDVRKKAGPDACPFNYMYWDFLDRNRAKLGRNQRLAMPYKTLSRMAPERVEEIRADAIEFFSSAEMRPDSDDS